jgi:hypothetical protein
MRGHPLLDGTNPIQMVDNNKLHSQKGKNLALDFDSNNAPTASSRGQSNNIETTGGQKLGLVPKPNLLQALDSTREPNEVNATNPIWSFIYNLDL